MVAAVSRGRKKLSPSRESLKTRVSRQNPTSCKQHRFMRALLSQVRFSPARADLPPPPFYYLRRKFLPTLIASSVSQTTWLQAILSKWLCTWTTDTLLKRFNANEKMSSPQYIRLPLCTRAKTKRVDRPENMEAFFYPPTRSSLCCLESSAPELCCLVASGNLPTPHQMNARVHYKTKGRRTSGGVTPHTEHEASARTMSTAYTVVQNT